MFSGFMTNAWIVGTIAAVIAGVVGFFVVLRGSAFAAHAIPNGAFAGAAAADAFGFSALLGLGVCAVLAALMIGLLGRRGRQDVTTALTLVMLLALGAVFLSRSGEPETAVYSLLFGEILGVTTTELVPVAALAAFCIVAVAVLYRPLLVSSVAPDLGEASGVRNRTMELAFLVVLALATALTVPVVGALLIFSLMIGPPSAARSCTDRAPIALLLSVVFAAVTLWASLALSYTTNWPVGFFVGGLAAVSFGVGRAWAWRRQHRTATAGRVFATA